MKQIKQLLYLVDAFKSLPGIGEKTATRLAVFLLEQDQHYQYEFIKRIDNAIHDLKKCKWCNDITTNDICDECKQNKTNKTLCIVINYEDRLRIEESKNYNGYFHTLMYPANEKKVNMELINIEQIINQINELQINEIIIATPFSILGEMIANYLYEKLKSTNENIFRIGFGIPLNANIDYIDDDTIRESLLNKKKIS